MTETAGNITSETQRLASPRYESIRKLLSSEVAVSKMLDYFLLATDPDDLLSKAGIRRHQLRALEMDDEIAQCIDTRMDAVASYSWRLEPNQTRQSRIVREMLEKADANNSIRSLIGAVPYGYVVNEAIWRRDRGIIILDRIPQKPMEWFVPMPDGSLRYFPDDGTGGLQGIPCDSRKFFLTVRNARYQNPRGDALLSRLWFPVTWRREGWGMWMHFLETFGDPIVLGQVPDFHSFVSAMKAQGVRSTIAWQSTSDRDHVSTITASAPGEFERLENAIIRRIQKLFLGQTLTSDVSSQGGSYAQAAVHNQVRHDKTRSDVRMATTTQQKIVNTICELNGFAPLRFVMNDDADLAVSRAARDSVLYPVLNGSGFRLSKDYFIDTYDYRDTDLEEIAPSRSAPVASGDGGDAGAEDDGGEPSEDGKQRSVADDGPEGKQAEAGVPVGAPKKNLTFAKTDSVTTGQAALDSLADQVIAQAMAMDRWPIEVADLQRAVREATDPQDLAERLTQVWKSSDWSSFADLLAVADFAARSLGYATAATGLA